MSETVQLGELTNFQPTVPDQDRGEHRPREQTCVTEENPFFMAIYGESGSSVLKCEAWDFSVFCRSQSFC